MTIAGTQKTDAIPPDGSRASAGSTTSAAAGWLRSNRQSLGLIPAIAAIIIIGTFTNSAFLTKGNFIAVFQGSAVLGMLVIGEAVVLIAGRFDLSLESIVGLAPMFAAWVATSQAQGGAGWLHTGALCVPICLAVGVAVGLVNGFAVVKIKINAFMMTLAMLILLRGITYALTNGATISEPPSSLVYIGQGELWTIPIEVYIVVGLFILAAVFMRRHRFGRALYAIGGNEEAARAAGLRVDRVLIIAYVIAGLLSAVGGMMLAGQVNAVTAEQGSGMIFTVFAAAVIGGISLKGGRGTMVGAGLGVLFLGLIENVLTLAQVSSQVIQAAEGLVILCALLVNRFTFERE